MCTFTRCCLVVTTVVIAGSFCSPVLVEAQSPAFQYSLDTVPASAGQRSLRMPVYLDHFEDTVGAFLLTFQVDRPGICSLKTTIDTAGCLLSGWPYFQPQLIDPSGSLLRVIAVHTNGPQTVAPLYPQADGPPLFYIRFDVFDSLTIFDVGAAINLRLTPYDFFQMSDPFGNLVGYTQEEQVDTNCYVCLEWLPPDSICLDWLLVNDGPCDSIDIVFDTVLLVDTAVIEISPQGWVSIVPWTCGDFDDNGQVSLTDVTLFVNYLFGSGTPGPVHGEAMDVAGPCLGQLNLTDITVLIQTLFLGGSPLECCVVSP